MRVRHLARAAGVNPDLAALELANRRVLQPLVLVARRNHLHLRRQVEPELERVRRLVAVRHLAMEHAVPGGHPLHVAGPERTPCAPVWSRCSIAPSRTMVTVCMPRCGCVSKPFGFPNQSSLRKRKRRGLLPALGADDELLLLDLRAPALRDNARDAADRPQRSLNLWILPVAVLGSSGRNSIQRGYL